MINFSHLSSMIARSIWKYKYFLQLRGEWNYLTWYVSGLTNTRINKLAVSMHHGALFLECERFCAGLRCFSTTTWRRTRYLLVPEKNSIKWSNATDGDGQQLSSSAGFPSFSRNCKIVRRKCDGALSKYTGSRLIIRWKSTGSPRINRTNSLPFYFLRRATVTNKSVLREKNRCRKISQHPRDKSILKHEQSAEEKGIWKQLKRNF